MLNILLLSPPIFDFYYTPARKEPLGLLYIKSALEKEKNVKVDIYDALLSGKKRKLSIPKYFDYLKHIYSKDTSYFSLFSNYYRFGDSFFKIVNHINNSGYDIVAISALFSGYYPDLEQLIRYIKNNTNTIVVVGGWAIDAEKEDLYCESKADFFLTGDGEESFKFFIKAFLNKISFQDVPGIIFRKNGKIIKKNAITNTAIKNTFPKRYHNYYYQKQRIAKVVISKGCLYKCKFCSIHRGSTFSLRTIESIEKELEYLVHLGIKIVDFEDDNLFGTVKFSNQFLNLLEKYHKKGLTYTAMNGITAKNILPFIEKIINVGFKELNFSLVISDNKLKDSFKRPFDIEIIKEIVTKIQGKIPTLVFLILGLPGSEPDMVLKDILELAKLPVSIGISPLYLIPGIPMFEKMGLPKDRRLLRGSALYKFDKSFSREDVASLWKFTRMINWMKEKKKVNSKEDEENICYFKKSIKEKRWYRKEKNGEWKESFQFKVNLPEDFDVHGWTSK